MVTTTTTTTWLAGSGHRPRQQRQHTYRGDCPAIWRQLLTSWTSVLAVVTIQPLAVGPALVGELRTSPATSGVAGLGGALMPPCGPGTGKKCEIDHSSTIQHDQPVSERQVASDQCRYPCNRNCSSQTKESCKFGVPLIRDGCDCCFMCARQQGDLCSYRDRCDEDKGLYCDMKLDEGQRGICRSRNAKPCTVDRKTYKDGEEFKPHCGQLCTCQDGRYACSSLCPQEFRPPSSAHCRDAQLVTISGRCCREWVCPHSHSLLGPDDNFHNESPVATSSSTCKIETSQWSSCSQTCGVGVSIRMTGDKDCQPVQERRLCIIRPCSSVPAAETDGKSGSCRTTWKGKKERITYGKCESVNELQPKYCSSCSGKRQQCCGPKSARNIQVQFKCAGQVETVVEKMMWIKSCECYKPEKCPFR